MKKKVLNIGGAIGFWGESQIGTPQLLKQGSLDYIVYDYLAEITLSIMSRAKINDPEKGYATDFITKVIKPNIKEIANQGTKVISNAGGLNPEACAKAIMDLLNEIGVDLKIAVISGDDLFNKVKDFKNVDTREMFSNDAFPDIKSIMSVNAYLGAYPIAMALNKGADIVITGRVVDSAVTLGACIHEFGWNPDEYDKLASGSLAGHILECTVQATGGNYTDWELVSDEIHNIGYPIAEISSDGSFVLTKPQNTGGIVNISTVTEQMLYEIGDPQAYILPDVVCDFSNVHLTEVAENRVKVVGAKGYPSTDSLKVSMTFLDGFRGGQILLFYGFNADKKAREFAKNAIKRAEGRLECEQLQTYTETLVEVIGDESHYGEQKSIDASREVSVKIAAKHSKKIAIEILFQEIIGLALAAPPGLTGFAGTRPKPSPVVRLFSFLVNKEFIKETIKVNDQELPVKYNQTVSFDNHLIKRPKLPKKVNKEDLTNSVPLIFLAYARSGDKGDKANIGIIARKSEYLPFIWSALTEEGVENYFSHFLNGTVERYFLPGSNSINYLLHNILGGGGIASLRNDPQGKGYGQLLLNFPIPVTQTIAETLQ